MLLIDKVFTTSYDKFIFIKGLVLIEIADGELSEAESDFIYNQAKLLDISFDLVDNLFTVVKESDFNYELRGIKFTSKNKAISFLIQAIRMGYQDGHYTQDEIDSVEKIAYVNGIDKETLARLDAYIKMENLIVVELDKKINGCF